VSTPTLAIALSALGGVVGGAALARPVAAAREHQPLLHQPTCTHCHSPLCLRHSHCPRCNGEGLLGLAVLLGVLGGVVLGLLAWRLHTSAALGAEEAFGLGAIGLSAVDWATYRLPVLFNHLTLGAVLLGEVTAILAGSSVTHLLVALAAGLAGFLFFFLVHLLSPKGMGFGDVRLAGVVGVACGWFGGGVTFLAFLTALVSGALFGLVAMVITGQGRKTKIPLGPFLALGALVALLLGPNVGHLVIAR